VGGIFTLNPALSAGQKGKANFLVGCAIKYAADRANQCLLLYTHNIRTRRLEILQFLVVILKNNHVLELNFSWKDKH
jgi:hypothetical protein